MFKQRYGKIFPTIKAAMLVLPLLVTTFYTSYEAAKAQALSLPGSTAAHNGGHDSHSGSNHHSRPANNHHNHSNSDHRNHSGHGSPLARDEHHSAPQQATVSPRCPVPAIDCACDECQHYFAVHFLTLLMHPPSITAIYSASEDNTGQALNLSSLSTPPPTPPPIYI